MYPPEVIKVLYRKGRQLNLKIEEHEKYGLEFIEAERKYNVALSTKMFLLKSEGNAISTCEKLAKGDQLIADLKFEMDKQDILRDSCKKALSAIFAQIDCLRSDLSFQKLDYKNIGATQQA